MEAKEQQVTSVFEFAHPSGCLTSSCLIPKLVMPMGTWTFMIMRNCGAWGNSSYSLQCGIRTCL